MYADMIIEMRELAKTMAVLYVEDDLNIRNEVSKILNKIFENVDVATNGDEGLTLYSQSKYDIVITDIEMPIKNGIEMIQQIKDINKKQVVAVLSAYDNPKYLLKLINHGIDMFMMKPLDLNEFFETMQKLIKNKFDSDKVEELEKQINEKLDIENMLLYSTLTKYEK